MLKKSTLPIDGPCLASRPILVATMIAEGVVLRRREQHSFGSFEPEVRRIDYGLIKNTKTIDPLLVGHHEFIDSDRKVVSARGWRDKLGRAMCRAAGAPTTL